MYPSSQISPINIGAINEILHGDAITHAPAVSQASHMFSTRISAGCRRSPH